MTSSQNSLNDTNALFNSPGKIVLQKSFFPKAKSYILWKNLESSLKTYAEIASQHSHEDLKMLLITYAIPQFQHFTQRFVNKTPTAG